MRKLKLYMTLGLSRGMRRLRMRDRIQGKAEELHEKDLDSRIPFLKKAFCGQDAAPRIIPVTNPPQFHEGQVFMLGKGILSILSNNDLTEKLEVFNRLNADSGLQALPIGPNKDKIAGYVVIRCKTELFGDLRISAVPDEFLSKFIGSSSGVYLAGIHQIAIKQNIASAEAYQSALIHEIEHASHFTLWGFAGLPLIFAPKIYAEYLSMLAEFIQFGTPDIGLFKSSKKLKKQSPHQRATGIFRENMEKTYGISQREVEIGLSILNPEEGEELTEKGLELVNKLKRAAAQEYARTYEQLFGLSLDDIREIIDSLPVI